MQPAEPCPVVEKILAPTEVDVSPQSLDTKEEQKPSRSLTIPATEEASVPASHKEAAVVPDSVREALECATSLAQGDDSDEALAVLQNSCQEAPADLLGVAYHAIIESQLRQEQPHKALETFHEMQQLGEGCCIVQVTTQEAALRTFMQCQHHGKASELLRAMCANNTPPGEAAFNSLIDAAVRARAYSEAWDLLELTLEHKRKADKYFVSILTKSLESSTSDRRWVRRGIVLVDKFIEQQRQDVDEIVFNSLLNVLGHIGDMLKLQQTLAKMQDYGVPPSAVTYGTVVKAYGRARDIDAVLKVWHDMRQRCLGVNPVTCGCVLDACVKCGHIDKAMAIFQEMRLQGVHKNTVLYATLIKGLAKVRDLMGAVHLYQEMRVEGVPCNLVTYNSLMDVCVRVGDLKTSALFLQDMIQCRIEPDLITFSTLIKGYSHIGEVYKSLELANELKSRGLRCDEIMYNSLIDGCAKANKLQEGLRVFEDMLQSRITPSNITFSILVKLHFEAGNAAEAFNLVEIMSTRYHCPPSRVVYTVLFRCCAQHGEASLPRGAGLLIDLAAKRNSKLPEQGMISVMVAGCIQHGDLETASRIVRDLASGSHRRGPGVPIDTLRSLFEAFGAANEAQAIEMLEHLRRKSFPADNIAQLQAAFAEGKNRGPGNAQIATSRPMIAGDGADQERWNASTPAVGMPSANNLATHYDPYWSQQIGGVYLPSVAPGCFNHPYQMMYQQGSAQHMGYYGGYQHAPMPNMMYADHIAPVGMDLTDSILHAGATTPALDMPNSTAVVAPPRAWQHEKENAGQIAPRSKKDAAGKSRRQNRHQENRAQLI